jgi:hypothetical protein
MNKRIRELALQANMTFNGTDLSGSIGRVQCYEDELEKFAELIVKECCLQVADVRIENDFEPVGDAVLVQALTGIKKHFGVEE